METENDSEFEEAAKSERKRKSPATKSPSQSPKKARIATESKSCYVVMESYLESAVKRPKTGLLLFYCMYD